MLSNQSLLGKRSRSDKQTLHDFIGSRYNLNSVPSMPILILRVISDKHGATPLEQLPLQVLINLLQIFAIEGFDINHIDNGLALLDKLKAVIKSVNPATVTQADREFIVKSYREINKDATPHARAIVDFMKQRYMFLFNAAFSPASPDSSPHKLVRR